MVTLGQCVAQLLGFRAGLLVDAHDVALRGAQHVDRSTKLVIEHAAIGDDDDRVEHLVAAVAMQPAEAVGEPGDGLGLTRAGRMPDQVTPAGPAGGDVAGDLLDGA